MSIDLRLEKAIHPVTALTFLTLDRPYLLAGEGQYLRIFDHKTSTPLSRHCIFNSETIHGISCSKKQDLGHSTSAKLLIWGARSLSFIELRLQESATTTPICLHVVSPEFRADDWILHVCFGPSDINLTTNSAIPEAVLVTAHNKLRSVAIRDGTLQNAQLLGSGPYSLLYSAHISWSNEVDGRHQIFVAAGTVFGEIHLWAVQCALDWGSVESLPCRSFEGHQGSVFGVRISDKVNVVNGSSGRLLASCSDDRTICIWNISHDVGMNILDESGRCLASTMAHVSRIWSVQFLYSQTGSLGVISFGEDGTAQIWLLRPRSGLEIPNEMRKEKPLELVHLASYRYHSGKNIWAACVLEEQNYATVFATGGADGRIVSCATASQSPGAVGKTISCQAAFHRLEITTDWLTNTATTREVVFKSLEGHWQLSRSIKSSLSPLPSGTFTGRADMKRRSATDADFDDEYLYSEEGDFEAERGLTMKARRQYVYRYNHKVDGITIWFVNMDDCASVVNVFHNLEFTIDETISYREKSKNGSVIITAKGHHLCTRDEYKVQYQFVMMGEDLRDWTIEYTVKGPEKDYVASAKYSRFSPEDEHQQSHTLFRNLSESDGQIERKRPSADAFKNYVWSTESEFLTTTEQGYVQIGKIEEEHGPTKSLEIGAKIIWTSIGPIDNLRSSCMLTSLPSLGACFLAGGDGDIFRYQQHFSSLRFIAACQQKPAYLKAQEIGVDKEEVDNNTETWERVFGVPDQSWSRTWISLVSVGRSSDHVVITSTPCDMPEDMRDSRQISFRLPNGFLVTSSCVIDRALLIILGSRNGAICICDPSRNDCTTMASSLTSVYFGIHGQDAITDIRMVPDSNALINPRELWILTTGRDGKFAAHLIRIFEEVKGFRAFKLKTYNESTLPFGPNIEGSHFDTSNGDLLLWGFRSKEFVVWNETKRIETMSVECGGAHRYWGFLPLNNGQGAGNFVWTKASVCHVYAQARSSHQVLQHGGHGREIKSITVSPDRECSAARKVQFVATGAEDTAIKIFQYTFKSGYRCLRTITKHTTGIQKLQWSGSQGQYLYSAAGCEEFFIWEMASLPTLGTGITCRASCPPVTSDKDLRIMDFCTLDTCVAGDAARESFVQLIAMVYSDSSVRIFEFCHTPREGYSLSLVLDASYTSHCLTKVTFLQYSKSLYLCTASTDGHLAFWAVGQALSEHGFRISENCSILSDKNLRSNSPTKVFSWQNRIPVHQNSIKSLIHVEMTSTEHLIVTGGDDQALGFNTITCDDLASAEHDKHGPRHATLLLPNVHASAVTGIALVSKKLVEPGITMYCLVTVGDDQRLKMWEIVQDDIESYGVEGFSIRIQSDVYTSIADASALKTSMVPHGELTKVFVAGVGMETWVVGGGVLKQEKE